MRLKYILLITLLVLSGCASDIQTVALQNTVSVTTAFSGYGQSSKAIGILAKEFKSNNAFTEAETKILLKAEASLLGEIEYMKNLTSFGGTVPYFEYIASYNRINGNIKVMSAILDEAIILYDDKTQVIYEMTRKNINDIFNAMATAISFAEEDINSRTTDNMIGTLQSLYGSVKPLISAAGVL